MCLISDLRAENSSKWDAFHGMAEEFVVNVSRIRTAPHTLDSCRILLVPELEVDIHDLSELEARVSATVLHDSQACMLTT